jgi:outer membrane biosynthesis protein TonB
VSEDLRRSVESHAAGCPHCRATLAALPGPLPAYGALAVVPLGTDARAALWRSLDARYPFGPAALAAASGPSTATVLTLSLIAGLVLAVAVLGLQLREQLRPNVEAVPDVLMAMPLTEDLGSGPTESPTVITPPATEEETEETLPEVTLEPTETAPPAPSPTPELPPPSPTPEPSPTPTPTPSPADTTPPSATILEPEEGAAYEATEDGDGGWAATVRVSGTGLDDVDAPDTLTYLWTTDREGDASLAQAQGDLRLACEGVAPVEAVTLSLRATDSSGNTSDPVSVRIQLTGCPVATPGG